MSLYRTTPSTHIPVGCQVDCERLTLSILWPMDLPFPIGVPLEPSHYLQPFLRYSAQSPCTHQDRQTHATSDFIFCPMQCIAVRCGMGAWVVVCSDCDEFCAQFNSICGNPIVWLSQALESFLVAISSTLQLTMVSRAESRRVWKKHHAASCRLLHFQCWAQVFTFDLVSWYILQVHWSDL